MGKRRGENKHASLQRPAAPGYLCLFCSITPAESPANLRKSSSSQVLGLPSKIRDTKALSLEGLPETLCLAYSLLRTLGALQKNPESSSACSHQGTAALGVRLRTGSDGAALPHPSSWTIAPSTVTAVILHQRYFAALYFPLTHMVRRQPADSVYWSLVTNCLGNKKKRKKPTRLQLCSHYTGL